MTSMLYAGDPRIPQGGYIITDAQKKELFNVVGANPETGEVLAIDVEAWENRYAFWLEWYISICEWLCSRGVEVILEIPKKHYFAPGPLQLVPRWEA